LNKKAILTVAFKAAVNCICHFQSDKINSTLWSDVQFSFFLNVEGMSNLDQTMSNCSTSVSELLARTAPGPCCRSAFLTVVTNRASRLRWLQVYKQQPTRKECSGARRHVELFASHVEIMSNFRHFCGHFTTWTAENDDDILRKCRTAVKKLNPADTPKTSTCAATTRCECHQRIKCFPSS
jgi:hypothetical protein